jgi:Transcription factor WhiB
VPRSAWGLETDRSLAWRQFAACGPDTAEWFWLVPAHGPTKLSADNRAALELCDECPVLRQCHQHEQGHRAMYPHIAAGLLWNVDGPHRIATSATGRKTGTVPAGTPSRSTNMKEPR